MAYKWKVARPEIRHRCRASYCGIASEREGLLESSNDRMYYKIEGAGVLKSCESVSSNKLTGRKAENGIFAEIESGLLRPRNATSYHHNAGTCASPGIAREKLIAYRAARA